MAGRRCVIDTSLILTLAAAESLELMFSRSRYRWHITPLVRGELTRRETRMEVDRSITQGRLHVAELDTLAEDELRLWGEWSRRVDAGEAEAIAIALSRDWLVGLEDRRAQRVLDRVAGAGHWINAANLLLDAVNDRVLSLVEADAVFCALDCYPGYRKRGVASLADLRRSSEP